MLMFLLMFDYKVQLGIASDGKGRYNTFLYHFVKKARFCNRRRFLMAVNHITIDVCRYANIRMTKHMRHCFKRHMSLYHGRSIRVAQIMKSMLGKPNCARRFLYLVYIVLGL